MSSLTWDLVSPVPSTAAPSSPVIAIAERHPGGRVGFLSNRKPNVTLIEQVFARLARETGVASTVTVYEKKGPGEGAAQDLLDQIAAECDAVVVGIGDCGSCTSWSAHDAVQLETRGLFTTMVCSDAFEPLAAIQLSSLGCPDLNLMTVSHPIGGVSTDVASAKAEQAWPGLHRWLENVTTAADRG